MPILVNTRRPLGYWSDFANLERELLAFINQYGRPGVMPTRNELKQVGYDALSDAIRKHGGFPSVAERLGLQRLDTRKSRNYWADFANLENDLQEFIDQHGQSGRMPTKDDLSKAKRQDLIVGIRRHGGMSVVAQRLELNERQIRKSDTSWNDFTRLEKALREFLGGQEKVMPRISQLREAGRRDLINAIHRHGGVTVVAERLGLRLPDGVKPHGYWNDPARLERAILDFISEQGLEDRLPSYQELEAAGHNDLIGAIVRYGGIQELTKRLNLKTASEQKPAGYWQEFRHLRAELREFIAEHGQPGIMPTVTQLREAEREDLVQAIIFHGGTTAVSQQLGLIRIKVKKPMGYWQDFNNIEREVRAFILHYGEVGQMPSQRDLERAKRNDLAAAIKRHGGLTAVADRLELEPHIRYDPSRWRNFATFKKELKKFIKKTGSIGVMPTRSELLVAHQAALAAAIDKYGGVVAVAQRLGLSTRSENAIGKKRAKTKNFD